MYFPRRQLVEEVKDKDKDKDKDNDKDKDENEETTSSEVLSLFCKIFAMVDDRFLFLFIFLSLIPKHFYI